MTKNDEKVESELIENDDDPDKVSRHSANTFHSIKKIPEEKELDQSFKHSDLRKPFKVVMIGDKGVGKRAIYSRFCNDGFYPDENKTKPGPGFSNQVFMASNDKRVNLSLWYPENHFN